MAVCSLLFPFLPCCDCSVCDVVADPYAWSLNPIGLRALNASSASICDDGNACSYNDICIPVTTAGASGTNATRNACQGTSYTCPLREIDSDLFNCYVSSSCRGDGTCNTAVKPARTLCLNATLRDPCMPVSVQSQGPTPPDRCAHHVD